jgi:hypothetical protein
MTEREARAERAVETARRVQAVIGTARFGATIAELETQFRTKLRDFVNGAAHVWVIGGSTGSVCCVVQLHKVCTNAACHRCTRIYDKRTAHRAELGDVHRDGATRDVLESREELDGILNLVARLDFNHFLSQRQGFDALLAAPA